MPLSISNLMKQDEEASMALPKELFKLIEEGETDYLGTGVSINGATTYMAYDIYDTISDEPVMKCIFSIINSSEGTIVADMDLIINNDERPVLFMDHILDREDVNENWRIAIGQDGKEAEVQTVNRFIIHSDLKGLTLPVSLSAFPFELVIGKTLAEVNGKLGFKQGRYGWEGLAGGLKADYLSDCRPFTNDDQDSFSVLIGQVIDLRKLKLALGDIRQDCVIADLATALGKLPVYLPAEYGPLLEKGCYMAMFADIKADLSCGSNSYYSTRNLA